MILPSALRSSKLFHSLTFYHEHHIYEFLSLMHATCPPIYVSAVWSSWYLATNRNSHYYVIFSSPLLLPVSSVQMLSSATLSNTAGYFMFFLKHGTQNFISTQKRRQNNGSRVWILSVWTPRWKTWDSGQNYNQYVLEGMRFWTEWHPVPAGRHEILDRMAYSTCWKAWDSGQNGIQYLLEDSGQNGIQYLLDLIWS
jgi:hypothetical protein